MERRYMMMDRVTAGPLIRRGCLVTIFVLIGALYTYLFYPGTMDWDSASIAKMAAEEAYTNWFPPAFTFLWRITGANPGVLWSVQIGLMLSGLCLAAIALWERRRPALAAALAVGAVAPPYAYLFHEMTKDTFMSAALIYLSGLGIYALTAPPIGRAARKTAFAAAIVLATLVLSTRYNAVFALGPIFWLAIHAITQRTMVRSALTAALALLVLIAGLSLFSQHVLRPLWRPTVTALIAFDLAGITKFSGASVSRFAETREHRDQIERCYSAEAWDPLVRDECAADFIGHVYRTYMADRGTVLREWAAAIVNHPYAYARHRTAHFLSLLRVTCEACWEMGIPLDEAEHNPPGMEIHGSPWAQRYEDAARGFFSLVRPWFALAGALVLGVWAAYGVLVRKTTDDPALWIVLLLSASAVLYTGAYLVVGVASQFRYVYWSYQALWFAIVIAANALRPLRVLKADALRTGPAIPRGHLAVRRSGEMMGRAGDLPGSGARRGRRS